MTNKELQKAQLSHLTQMIDQAVRDGFKVKGCNHIRKKRKIKYKVTTSREFFNENKNSPPVMNDFFKRQILNCHLVGITLTYDHGNNNQSASTRFMNAQLDANRLVNRLNYNYFKKHKNGKLRRLYLEGNKDILFSVVGVFEHPLSNSHVHLILRPAANSIIGSNFIRSVQKIWKEIAPLGNVRFEKYLLNETPQKHVVSLPSGYSATLKDGVKPVDNGWGNYMGKDFRSETGKLCAFSEIIV